MKYNIEEITKKANYCLNCKTKPCKLACPLQNNIPDFIQKIKNVDYDEGIKILSETTIFEPICGRICPYQSQCQGKCVRGIKGDSVKIGELETFLGDMLIEKNIINVDVNNGKNIAVIGSGPAGIAAAYYLSIRGYKVTIFEKHSNLGGLLRYGIPEFRLPTEVIDKWLKNIVLNNNIEVRTNTELGKNVELNQLKQEYNAIILAFGANVSSKMNIPGEEFKFVLGANELLEYRNMPNFVGKKVAVIGGGNVAMDASRTINKLGAKEVTVIYRRAQEQMPAETKEIEDAKNEGIKFLFQTNVLKILENNQIECIKTELIQKEGEDRKIPVNIKDSNYLMNMDFVVMAVGSNPNKNIIEKLNLETTKWGYIKVDENYKTSDCKIYAVGDLIGTKQTVAWAAKSGFECAKKINTL